MVCCNSYYIIYEEQRKIGTLLLIKLQSFLDNDKDIVARGSIDGWNIFNSHEVLI